MLPSLPDVLLLNRMLATRMGGTLNTATLLLTLLSCAVCTVSQAQSESGASGVAHLSLPAGTFDFSLEGVALPIPVDNLEAVAETLLAYVIGRIDGPLAEDIDVTFRPAHSDLCGARGIGGASGNGRGWIWVYVPEDATQIFLMGLLAHEIGHVIYPVRRRDESLRGWAEGVATYAAGVHWLAWQGHSSFADAVRRFINESSYIPLAAIWRNSSYEEPIAAHPADCLERRDILYTEWAAFVEWVIESRGRDALRQVMRGTNLSEAVGGSVAQLEEEWLFALRDTSGRRPALGR